MLATEVSTGSGDGSVYSGQYYFTNAGGSVPQVLGVDDPRVYE